MDQLKSELRRCKEICETGVLQSANILCQSAFIEILIRFNYILQSLKKRGEGIHVCDDVPDGKDITSLVNEMRNAACHQDSPLNSFGNSTLIFNRFIGSSTFRIGDKIIGSKYADDIAFNYGENVIYLKRHIHKLLNELTEILK